MKMNEDIIPYEHKKAFWFVVEQCLIEFHKIESGIAHNMCVELYDRINEPIEDDEFGDLLFYHNDPLHVSIDMTGNKIVEADYLERYLKIRDETEVPDTYGCDFIIKPKQFCVHIYESQKPSIYWFDTEIEALDLVKKTIYENPNKFSYIIRNFKEV